jgi:hypothetical protein
MFERVRRWGRCDLPRRFFCGAPAGFDDAFVASDSFPCVVVIALCRTFLFTVEELARRTVEGDASAV